MLRYLKLYLEKSRSSYSYNNFLLDDINNRTFYGFIDKKLVISDNNRFYILQKNYQFTKMLLSLTKKYRQVI